MTERIDRKTDEKLYQPKIHSERIRQLYILRTITGIPMTVLTDRAIGEFVATYEVNNSCDENGKRTYYPE
jgi:hypothetical protein